MTQERLAEITASILEMKHELVRARLVEWNDVERVHTDRLIIALANAFNHGRDLRKQVQKREA